MYNDTIEYAHKELSLPPNPLARRRRRRYFAYFGIAAMVAAAMFIWKIWPGPMLWYYCSVDYGNIRFAGRHQTPLLQRQKPIFNELHVNGYIGKISPQHNGTTFSRGDWQFVIGKDTAKTLDAAGWRIESESGSTYAVQSDSWGKILILFDEDQTKSISVTVTEAKPGVTIRNPSFAPGKSVTLPCRSEDIIAAFGNPERESCNFLH